jgi:hypothetical protein
MEMVKLDIDQLLDSTADLITQMDDFNMVMIEIDEILENTCDW